MSNNTIQLEPSWQAVLGDELQQPYMHALKQFLVAERQAGKVIFPADEHIFHALDTTPFEAVKVVILGQDPYHGPGQAHGLSFSVPPGIKIPPSLRNIYKEIERDFGFKDRGFKDTGFKDQGFKDQGSKDQGLKMPSHGCLQSWAQQGVLLLNATLTVEQAQAGSHQRRGWELFTDKVVQSLSEQRSGLVFLLWGSYAQKKGRMIDRGKHCVLESVHPSPLSAHRGFLGCGHFSQANHYLQQQGLAPIDWSLPDIL